MKQNAAIKALTSWDRKGRSVFRKSDLGIIFDETGRTLDQTLARLVKNGILERVAHGVYLYAHSRHIGYATIEHIARNLRRGEITYESLESALSQYGVISQIPIDRVTLMTTGRSGEYDTPFGVIEFTHTKANIGDILAGVLYREDHPLPIASKQYAYANLRSTGRNLNMIDEEELHATD
ncbi:MAG: DUF6088 family protein [Actinomycetia bacterium]|nr:DUF6088 family protein [Actinomycetes bacterium]